jgi:hypothetical protein
MVWAATETGMTRLLAPGSVACVALALAAGPAFGDDPPVSPATNAPAATESHAIVPNATTAIDPSVHEPVCRRYIPTGSRIATQRCEMPKDALSTNEQASREVMRRDIADMRMQQQLRDQARAAAMAQALRRRADQ